MISTTIRCDKCGKDIPSGMEVQLSVGDKFYDLHAECSNEITSSLKGGTLVTGKNWTIYKTVPFMPNYPSVWVDPFFPVQPNSIIGSNVDNFFGSRII